jgi:hypothetical protein
MSNTPVRSNFSAYIAALLWGLALLAGHFLALGWFAHWIGTPLSLPSWLSGINRMFRYGFSSSLDLFIEVVWIVILAATVVVLFYLHALPGTVWPRASAGVESADDAFGRAFFACIPVGVLLWLLLAILPLQSHNLPQSPTGLETLHGMSWDDSLFELTEGIAAMLFIGALFLGIFLAFMFFERFMPKVNDGCGWQLIAAILFGIVLMLAVGLPSGPALEQVHQAHGSKIAFLLTYAAMLVFLVPVGLSMARFDPKKKEEEHEGAEKAGE